MNGASLNLVRPAKKYCARPSGVVTPIAITLINKSNSPARVLEIGT
jgi:hypothetical protein